MTTRSRAPKIKKTKHLTLRDRLSRLNYLTACKLLGPDGDKLIQQGAKFDIDIQRDVYLRGDLFRLKFAGITGEKAVATITTMAEAKNRLRFNCTACETMCEHVGAAVSLVLEEKTALGLAVPPDERRPLELERGGTGRTPSASARSGPRTRSSASSRPMREAVDRLHGHQRLSGKTYRVALRGEERGQSFCSCPDFRTNTLGTCKHILHVLEKVQRRFPAAERAKPYRNREAFVHVLYGEEMTLHCSCPTSPTTKSPSWPAA